MNKKYSTMYIYVTFFRNVPYLSIISNYTYIFNYTRVDIPILQCNLPTKEKVLKAKCKMVSSRGSGAKETQSNGHASVHRTAR